MTGDDSATANSFWGEDWSTVRSLWPLDPAVAHLNHGSFGAPPRRVLDEQDRWRVRAASNPMRYWLIDEIDGVVEARRRAAGFLGADGAGVALVPNVTTAASTVLAGLDLSAGDEVVLTDHGYGAVRLAALRLARRTAMRVVEVPLEIDAPDEEIRARVLAAVTPATRLVVVDHITSPTARVFPAEAIAAALAPAAIPCFIDAAHVPGQLPVDLSTTAAAFWTGNFHKWACAARGTAALVVGPSWRERIAPLVTSWLTELGYPGAFDLGGTQDQSAWLALPSALDFGDDLGWDRLRAHGAALATYGQQVVADALGVRADQLWGDDRLWMRCIPLPRGVATTQEGTRALWRRISDELGCEVGVTLWRDRAMIRISAHAYNAPSEYERLAVGLRQILG